MMKKAGKERIEEEKTRDVRKRFAVQVMED